MENLNPALPKIENPTNLNDVVFQSTLSSWLEDKGFIADIQSQIRLKLVNILRNTAIGRNLYKKFAQNNSLFKQALNMIVAEYLLRNEYEYSLSVFSTETALVNVSNYLLQDSEHRLNKKMFDFNDILHIFEVIGIPETTKMGSEILKLYKDSEGGSSILCCLINALKIQIKTQSELDTDQKVPFDITNECNLVKQIFPLLEKFRIPIDDMKYLIDSIKKIHFSEVQNVEIKHFEELLRYKKEIEVKDKIIEDMSKSNRKLENNLIKLARDYSSLKHQKQNKENLKDLENVQAKNNLNEQNNELKKDYNCSLPHCGTICESNSNAIEELKTENRFLNKKIFDLKTTNETQQKEMEALSLRYYDLRNAFMDCQNRLLLLTSRESTGNYQDVFQQIDGDKLKSKGKVERNPFNSELSSESITEEIVKEAKQRLRTLDNESNELQAIISSMNSKLPIHQHWVSRWAKN